MKFYTKTKMVFLICAISISLGLTAKNPPYRFAEADPTHEMVNFYYTNIVTKTDFQRTGQTSLLKTLTITTPGTYTFGQDVTSNIRSGRGHTQFLTLNDEGEGCAIFINANDVTVDFGNKTLVHSAATGTKLMCAVEIASGKRNILIKNGNISNFSGCGILTGSGCRNLRFQDLTISACGLGILVNSGVPATIVPTKNVTIKNCSVNGGVGVGVASAPIGAFGMTFIYGHNILITNSIASNQSVASIPAVGVFIASCTNVVCSRVITNNNSGTDADGFKAASRDGGTTKAVGLIFSDCTSNGNFGNSGQGTGFYLEPLNSSFFTNCTASSNYGIATGHGFYLSSCNYSVFNNCIAIANGAGNSSSGAQITSGFFITGSKGNLLKNCRMIGNGQGIGSGASSAFTSAGVYNAGEDIYIENSTLVANGNASFASSSYGIFSSSTSTNNMINKCQTYNHLSATSGAGYGVNDSASSSSSVISDNISFGNKGSSTYNNYSATYTNGSLNVTSNLLPGGLGALTTLIPYQNTSVNAS